MLEKNNRKATMQLEDSKLMVRLLKPPQLHKCIQTFQIAIKKSQKKFQT